MFCVQNGKATMTQYQIFLAISHMDGHGVDANNVSEVYSSTLAEIAEKISNEEMRRLLLIGAYLYQRGEDDMDRELSTGMTPTVRASQSR